MRALVGSWQQALRALVALALALTCVPAMAQDWVYSARAGDTLWDLSKRYLRSVAYFESLRAYNNITDPTRLRPGQPIRMPVRWLKRAPTEAIVVIVEGAATRLGATGVEEPLVPGMRLGTGDGVRTGAAASVTLQFADGSRLLLESATEMRMDMLEAYGDTGMVDTRLDLQRGRLDSRTRPAAGPGSRFEIRTPSAIAAVRGTDFRVEATPDGQRARGEVLEGELRVRAAGTARGLPAGFGMVVETGSAPPPPVELLPAPDLSALPQVVDRVQLVLEWPPVAGAETYRAQLFEGDRPDRLLLDAVNAVPGVGWDAPPDGVYLLRVRAVAANGLEGLNALHALTIDARPEPPLLLGPGQASARPEGTPVELWWAVPADAARFHLQVARDAAFTELIEDVELEGDRATVGAALAPGTYHWRVATRDAAGEHGPFGDARSFRIQVVPDAPGVLVPELGEDMLELAWGKALNAATYEYQLARDDGFEDLVESGSIEGTGVTLAKPGSGTYHFRSRGVSDEGVPGAWTRPQSFNVPAGKPYWLLLLLPLLLLL